MNEQRDLFAKQFASAGAGFRPAKIHAEPLIWVKNLLLLREWKEGEESVIRRISLRPGLNILWAKPRAQTDQLHLGEQGVFGHASGKTSFCRLLRYVLGEKHFGTPDLQSRVREVFRGGWIVGEVRLKEESWLVCRPFTPGAHPFVYRGAQIERLFDESLNKERLDVYEAAINKLVMDPLPVATFATSPEPIEWPHLIQWLSRDQECRFADLTDFRHKSSFAESPEMDVEDRHFLFRGVSGLIDTVEQAELERNKSLVFQKQKAEKRAPLLKYQAEVTLKRLREELSDVSVQEDELFLAAVQKNAEDTEVILRRTIQTLRDPSSLIRARQEATTAEARVENKLAEIRDLAAHIEGLELQHQVALGHKPQSEVEEFWRKRSSGAKICMEPLVRAQASGCPLAAGKVIIDSQGPVSLKIEQKAEEIQEAISVQKKQLATLEKANSDLEITSKSAQQALTAAQADFNRERDRLVEQRLKAQSIIRRAKEAKEDGQEAKTLAQTLENLEKEIRLSREKQAEAREKQKKALSDFSDTFDRVAKAILGLEVSGAVSFDGRQIAIKMTERGDLTSAAIETLKILVFDLAALIASVEGRGFHPRFLIHDGPREADMAVDLYHKLFMLAHAVESAFDGQTPSFQYIVTTTEPPPANLQEPPWRLDPILDASTKDGRLFREDL